jgi:hypothetical protein
MEITYYTKNVYGLKLKYPVSKDAVMVCKLMGMKTLTEWAIKVVEANGATITEVHNHNGEPPLLREGRNPQVRWQGQTN